MNDLTLRDLACQRGGRTLFSGLQSRIAGGQVLRVKGLNGAGKTSLLRMLCGLVVPHQGTVLWNGMDLNRWGIQFHQQLIYLGHAPALKDDLSAIENLQFSLLVGGTTANQDQAESALHNAGLTQRMHLPVRALSQGQRKRVALARLCLSTQLPLWVLDEPFNALDSLATQWLSVTLADHLGRGGMVVLTSHQMVPWSTTVIEESISL